jgi:hypothetical protein
MNQMDIHTAFNEEVEVKSSNSLQPRSVRISMWQIYY